MTHSFVDEHVGRASVSIPPEKHKGFAPTLLKYRDRITSLFTTTEDDGTVATKTKKALDSQRKPRLFDSRGERIRTFDPLVPNQMR